MSNSDPAINRGSKRSKPRERGSGCEAETQVVDSQDGRWSDLIAARRQGGVSVLRTSESIDNLSFSRPDGRGYFLTALRACTAGFLGALIGLTPPSATNIVVAAEPEAVAFPVAEAEFAAGLVGIDREWNISFKAAGKVRVMGAGELAYWGRWRDVEGGPQIVLSDGGVVRADVLLVDEKQVVVGDATGLGRGFWEESTLPRGVVRALMLQPPAAEAERDRLWKRLANSRGTDDTLILVGGETIMGTLVSAPRLGRFAPDDAKPGSEKFEIVRRGDRKSVV